MRLTHPHFGSSTSKNSSSCPRKERISLTRIFARRSPSYDFFDPAVFGLQRVWHRSLGTSNPEGGGHRITKFSELIWTQPQTLRHYMSLGGLRLPEWWTLAGRAQVSSRIMPTRVSVSSSASRRRCCWEAPRSRIALGTSTCQPRPVRYLNITDKFTKNALAIEVERSMTGDDIVTVLERLIMVHGAPGFGRMDDGTEMTSNAVADWCRFPPAGITFIDPDSPWQNATVESFTGWLRVLPMVVGHAGDRGLAAECGVWPVMVVDVEPAGQGGAAG